VILSVFEMRGTKPPSSETAFFWTFFALLYGISYVVHRWMEVPVRAWMRRTLIRKPAKDAGAEDNAAVRPTADPA